MSRNSFIVRNTQAIVLIGFISLLVVCVWLRSDISIGILQQATDPAVQGVRLMRPAVYTAFAINGNFRAARLQYINIYEQNIHDSDFSSANLVGVRFDYSQSFDVLFTGANLRSSYFRTCNLVSTTFDAARMDDSLFSSCLFHESSFKQSSIKNSTFDGSESIFLNSILSGADFSSSDLRQSIFAECDLSGVNLAQVKMQFAQFRDTSLENANLSGAEIVWTRFADVDFRQVTGLDTVSFQNSCLYRCINLPASVSVHTQSGNLIITSDKSEYEMWWENRNKALLGRAP